MAALHRALTSLFTPKRGSNFALLVHKTADVVERNSEIEVVGIPHTGKINPNQTTVFIDDRASARPSYGRHAVQQPLAIGQLSEATARHLNFNAPTGIGQEIPGVVTYQIQFLVHFELAFLFLLHVRTGVLVEQKSRCQTYRRTTLAH